MWDSDEEVLERILKLPPQVYHSKNLFSIPEVTEEEDNTLEDYEPPRRAPARRSVPTAHPRSPRRAQSVRTHVPPQPQAQPLQSSLRPASHQGRRSQLRVHYADQVATISYPEEEEYAESDTSLYDGPDSRKIWSRRRTVAPAAPPPAPAQRSALHGGGGGDRLRREAMLRNQMASHVAETVAVSAGPPPCPSDGAYLLSRTVHRVKSPTGTRAEIDVEYGTDNDEEAAAPPFDPGEVVVEQMSSEWWVEGGHHDCHRPVPAPRRPNPEMRALPAPGHHAWVC